LLGKKKKVSVLTFSDFQAYQTEQFVVDMSGWKSLAFFVT